MITRIILSVLAFVAYGMSRQVFNPVSTLVQGEAAVSSFSTATQQR